MYIKSGKKKKIELTTNTMRKILVIYLSERIKKKKKTMAYLFQTIFPRFDNLKNIFLSRQITVNTGFNLFAFNTR